MSKIFNLALISISKYRKWTMWRNNVFWQPIQYISDIHFL